MNSTDTRTSMNRFDNQDCPTQRDSLDRGVAHSVLLGLPTELLGRITEALPIHKLQSLRLMCQTLRDPVLTRHLTVYPSSEQVKVICSDLKTDLGTGWFLRESVRLPKDISHESVCRLVEGQRIDAVKRVDLSGCQAVNDQTVEALITLENLTDIDIIGCERVTDIGIARLTGSKKALGISLRKTVSHEEIVDLVESGTLKFVKRLDLSHCESIQDNTLEAISTLDNLTHLDISHCEEVTDAGLAFLAKTDSLIDLNLSVCRGLSPRFLEALEKFPRLTTLDITGCYQFSELDDEEVLLRASFEKLKGVTRLKLSGRNWITPPVLRSLFKLSALKELAIVETNRLSDDDLKGIDKLANLTRLSLSESFWLGDPGIEYITQIPTLERLDIDGSNGVTREYLKNLREHTHLKITGVDVEA